MIEQLLAMFPDARFIHVARDGRDAVLSMQEHVGFRLGLLGQFLGVNPLDSADRIHIDRVFTELRPLLPEHFDADAFRAFRLALPLCGEFWARQIDTGLKVLSALPADRLLTSRYGDFFVRPKQQLDILASFLGKDFVDDDWATRCAAISANHDQRGPICLRRPRAPSRRLADRVSNCFALPACITIFSPNHSERTSRRQ